MRPSSQAPPSNLTPLAFHLDPACLRLHSRAYLTWGHFATDGADEMSDQVPLRVLSLGECHVYLQRCSRTELIVSTDGGGIRGISSLLILENIMERIRQERCLQTVPRPCEYFDLIGGTSTGG